MKLTYRGVTYDYNPPQVERGTEKVGGTYRGLDWRFRNLKKPPVLQPSYNLTYRGVKYSNHPVPTPTEAQDAPLSVAEKARVLMLNRERATLNRDLSMFNRLADEVGLNTHHLNSSPTV